jgi:hypothetical protein
MSCRGPCAAQIVFMPEKRDHFQGPGPVMMASRNDPEAPEPVVQPPKEEVARKPYQFLMISILREYLQWEFRVDIPGFKQDLERVIDDFGAPRGPGCLSGTTRPLCESDVKGFTPGSHAVTIQHVADVPVCHAQCSCASLLATTSCRTCRRWRSARAPSSC